MKKLLLKLCDSLHLFPLFNIFTKNRATVFMIHHFCNRAMRDGTFVPADFLDRCLSYLVNNGYSAISLSAYVNKLMNHNKLYKSVVFTVDDGYRDFLEYGYPVFRRYNIPLAVFIATDFIEGKTRLWWDEIKLAINNTKLPEIEMEYNGESQYYRLNTKGEKLHAVNKIVEYCKKISNTDKWKLINKLINTLNVDTGLISRNRSLSWEEIIELQNHRVEFFPHTKTHPILVQCSEKQLHEEIHESRRMLQSKLGKPSDVFCYPNGRFSDFNDNIINILKKQGYRAAFTVEEGFDRPHKDVDLFRLRRYAFPDDLIEFKQLISGFEAFKNIFRRN